MFLTGCETSKHAEVMGDESLAAKRQAEQMQVADSGGIPLDAQGMSQESISASLEEPPDFSPEGPPGATLRGLDRGTAVGEEMATVSDGPGMAPIGEPEIPETVSPGPPPVPDTFPTGNRGPASGFSPEGPPMPSFEEPGDTGGSTAPMMSTLKESSVAAPEETFEPGPSGYEGQEFDSPSTPSGFTPQSPPFPTFGRESGSESESVVEVPEMMAATPPPTTPPPTETMPLEADDVGMTPTPMSEVTDVFFDFDQYAIRSDAAATLAQNAQILQNQHPGASILIEGHCDERGTEEYNMVLGERRALAVKRYLVDLGIPASTIQIVSYGKERPFCTEHYDACWDQNRRGHFVIR